MDKHLLEILCCPSTKMAMRLARQDEIAALNRSIALGNVNSVAGTSVATPLAEALITRDGKTIYRIDDGIPVMLIDEGINTHQIVGFPE
ncbi:MAG TPA: Trm112 family protein [Dokdonella sp.]|uniref:Trm112 family protein n=1 Tax=Dokdonella sp. TaxID=2291710 RepID=UPI002D80523D|nr:Trm112 family protein [Dokdonella sp.]HET9031867.1 Trm112 family protein [Dokdonella sp.]